MVRGRLRFQVNLGKDAYWDPSDPELYVDELEDIIVETRNTEEVFPRARRTSEIPEEAPEEE